MEIWSLWQSITGFLQAVAVSILQHGDTTWKLMKCMEKKLEGNYTRMLCSVLNKSWKQHALPAKTAALQPLTFYLTNHSSKMNKTCGALQDKQGQTQKQLFSMGYSTWTNQCWPTRKDLLISALCQMLDVVWRTYHKRWMTGMVGVRVKKLCTVNMTRWW